MAFSNDEALLNSINLDSINQYAQFIEAMRPILLGQSGYQQVSNVGNISKATQESLSKAQREQTLLQKGLADTRVLQPEERDEFMKIVEREYGGTPQNSNQWNHAREQLTKSYAQKIAGLEAKAQREQVSFEMTPEAKANKEAFDRLAQVELQQLQRQAEYLQGPEYQANLAKQRELATLQQENAAAMAQRQGAALRGEIGTSPVLQKNINDSFQKFKEAQAKAGNIILGNSIDEAVGKGTAATEALAKFQDNVNALKQRETESIINQTPLSLASTGAANELFAGLNIGRTGQFSNIGFGQAYGAPMSPDYGGLSSLTLSGHQPFQFNRQMSFQEAQFQQQLQDAARSRKSGLLGAGIGALGAIGGAFIGGPMGAGAGYQLGQQVGTSLA